MSTKLLSGPFAAAILFCAATAGAQTAAQAPADQKAGADSPAITVAGCVQNESGVLKANPVSRGIGMGDEFVIVQAVLSRGGTDKPAEPPAAEPGTTPAAPGNFGKVYRVTGDKESELKNYVGQRVEIAGTFKHDEDAKAELGAIGTSGRTPSTELTPENTPEITITAIRPVSGACAVAIK